MKYQAQPLPQVLLELKNQVEDFKELTEQQRQDIISDPELRVIWSEDNFAVFMAAYLSHYWALPAADFHQEIIELLENPDNQFIAITGFRGSGKSSIVALAFVLWCALFEKVHFIITVNETDEVSKINIANLREELQANELIAQDFGNVISSEQVSTKFTENNVLMANGVRVMARSRGQKIRGLRHKQYRPELVIIDDCEEIEKVQSKKYRDKTESWVRGVVIPAIDEFNARLVIIGNELHRDALMARLRKHKLFVNRSYPLVTETGTCTWAGKYPTPWHLERQEEKVGRAVWQREYLLKVIPEEEQIIKFEDIHYYHALPTYITQVGAGVDLAISQKQTADYTAMVSGVTSIVEGLPKIYILPKPINERMGFKSTISSLVTLKDALAVYGMPMFWVEAQAYQQAAVEIGQDHLLPITPLRSVADKRARLSVVAMFIQNGTVLFPPEGAEELIEQLLDFGAAEHDDLVDALVFLLLAILQQGVDLPKVVVLG